MNTSPIHRKRGKPGFASYVLVLSTGAVLLTLTFYAYKRAMNAREIQSSAQLRGDYGEKEDAILRAIVAITPNRAIQAMRHNSNSSPSNSEPLKWETIFKDAFDLANARTSIPEEIRPAIALTNPSGSSEVPSLIDEEVLNTKVFRSGNSGDSSSTLDAVKMRKIFTRRTTAPSPLVANTDTTPLVVAGVNRSYTGFPAPLTTVDSNTIARDEVYPIISNDKQYGSLAVGDVKLPVADYKRFNQIKYPNINFGYARPGELFVAKRNWWAFSLDAAAQEFELTNDGNETPAPHLGRRQRDFVLSIYEIPSQLAISASSFMAFGQFESESGPQWANVNIEGNVFAGRAQVESGASLESLASRRSMTLSDDAIIGDPNQPLASKYKSNPFAAGAKEDYYQENQDPGAVLPLSLASESGRVAFIPINRGEEFFDRFHDKVKDAETNTVSPTTWNNYSVGALQCAMRVDIAQVKGVQSNVSYNPEPTVLRFSYLKNGERLTYVEPLVEKINAPLPPGYVKVTDENKTHDFGTAVVDVAYGMNGKYFFQTDVSGPVTFNNTRFGDPIQGTFKAGFFRPSAPYKVKLLPSKKICIAIYPQRFKDFLARIQADGTGVNNSLVVNVDYTANVGTFKPRKPTVDPNCLEEDPGVILQECADLTSFRNGFSLVTNLRTYIGEDFNVVPTTPPSGFVPAVTADNPEGKYYPPASLFAPEKRYGVEVDPFAVNLRGQVGSLAKGEKVYATDPDPKLIRPLDSKTVGDEWLGAGQITVNLLPITHPAELPPITMMNWLVVLEERRGELEGN